MSVSVSLSQVGKIRKTAARKREYHVLFMVITTVVCYLLCWMPYGVVAMMATFGRPGIISPVASVVPSLLAKSSTVINPLIYILMNKQVTSLTKSYHFFLIYIYTGTSKKERNMKKVNIFGHSFQKVKPIYYLDSLHTEWNISSLYFLKF